MTEERSVSERLVDAAEELFCEKGYDATTVREIVKAADCNIAAINYHFGGKDKLYIEMFRRHMGDIFNRRRQVLKDVFACEKPTLEMLVGAVAEDVIEDFKNRPYASAISKMLIREIMDPHFEEPVFEHDKVIEIEGQFAEAIAKLVPNMGRDDAMMGLFSMRGLFMSMVMFNDIHRQDENEVLKINTLDRLVTFICAGIRSLV